MTCPCVARHSPPAIVIETHHVLPLSWGGQDEPTNKVAICAQTHFTVHHILNAFVHADAAVARQSGWPRYAYGVAVQGWNARIPGHPTPFWEHV